MSEKQRPPRWVDWLIDVVAPDYVAEEVRGDLCEVFMRDAKRSGIPSARRAYARNGLGFLFKRFFWTEHNSKHRIFMVVDYFKMARRSLLFYKGNTTINMIGLVTGMAAALILIALIHYERSFDAYHTDAGQIYRVVRVTGTKGELNDRSECRTGVSYPVPVAFKAEIPFLKDITSMLFFGGVKVEITDKSGDVRAFTGSGGAVVAEPSFFSMFDFKGTSFRWLEGNPTTSLTEPFSIVLTESEVKRFFPDGKAMGKVVKLDGEINMTVTGVTSDFPANTDFPFSMIVSYASLRKLTNGMDDWNSVDDSHCTFVKLAPGNTKEETEIKMARVHAAHTPKELSDERHYLLQPLKEMHYDGRFGNFNGRTISHETVLALKLIALFLVLTASINYINLATAQSAIRAKEIGLRKVMGSQQRNLIFQFMTETFLVVLCSGVVALIVAEIAIPYLKTLLSMKTHGLLISDPYLMGAFAMLIIVITLISGSYPALMISKFNPVASLRAKFTSVSMGGVSLRKLLVAGQFTITQMLVVGTFIVVSQMDFFQNRDMGFNKDAILTFPVPDRHRDKLDVFTNDLRAESFVSGISYSSSYPSGMNRGSNYVDVTVIDAKGVKVSEVLEWQIIDPGYLDLYELKLLAGRNLILADTSRSILLNESLVRKLQLGTPANALGKVVWTNGQNLTVVGVLRDFYSNSLKSTPGNTGLVIQPKRYYRAGVKLNIAKGESAREAILKIEKLWQKQNPEGIFDYEFLEDKVNAFYEQESKYADLFKIFAVIFVVIGCLGLYGLIAFVVNRKGKEVAIRKVLGAQITHVLFMFSKEYVQLILISFLLAVPVAWYGVNEWLSGFAEHIPLRWWNFALPGCCVLIIALLVVISKSMRVAQANPVNALKSE